MTPRFVRLVIAVSTAVIAPALTNAADTPRFSSYPAKVLVESKDTAVDLSSNTKARRYRTVLRDGAAKGPNFGGGYTFVSWGCGTACQEFAVIDAKTGRVYFPKKVKLNAYQAVTDGTPPFEYRLDSRLLILAGSPNDGDEAGIFYYEWTGEDFRRVSKQLRKWPR
jgi:hypothetical protein